MNPKLKKIEAEYEKNAAKIAELQSRQRELDKQRTEIKNNEILELVQEHKLDFAALSALLQTIKTNPAAVMQGETEESV